MPKCKCFKCGHKWIKRVDKRPLQCPECKSRKWDAK